MLPNSEQHTSKICLHSSESTWYSGMQFSHILQFKKQFKNIFCALQKGRQFTKGTIWMAKDKSRDAPIKICFPSNTDKLKKIDK